MPQYDAVNILLQGKSREECGSNGISDADTTGYTSGKRHIKKDLLAQVTRITIEEAEERIDELGFQDVAKVSRIVLKLLRIVDISDDTRMKIEGGSSNTTLIANTFMMAIKCPAKNVFPLGMTEKKRIAFCYSDIDTTASSTDTNVPVPFFEDEAESISKEVSNSSSSTSASNGGIAKILSVTRAAQERERELAKPALPEIMDPIFSTYYIHERDKKINFFYELVNEAVSSGLTAMSDFFERPMRPKLPFYVNYYDDRDYLVNHLFRNKYIKVFFEFFAGAVDCYKRPDPRNIYGVMVFNIEQPLLRTAYTNYIRDNTTPFLSYAEPFYLEMSMYGEVGNIFSGSVATAISNFLDCPILIREINISELEQALKGNGLILAGNIPFRYINGDVCGAGTILVRTDTMQKLLDIYEENM